MKQTRRFLICAACVALVAAALPAVAGPPERSFQLRLGGFFPEGDGEFWSESEDVFTLQASDFDDSIFGITYQHAFNRYFQADFNADFYDETVVSEYRDFVDGSGFPIFHDSTLRTVPVTVGVRFTPFGLARHGRSKPVLFVGAGAGVNFWRYEEFGDFIDFSDPLQPIVLGDFRESGAAFVSYAAAGFEVPLSPNFALGVETRYFHSDDKFENDFAGLGKIDMSGPTASVSANWRF